jgi:phenylacetyl-CoA:acceptor oxidoreductase subunit 2
LRTRGVEPSRQQHWDWKAAGNFICGGMGSGLFLFTALASFRYHDLVPLGLFALGLVGLGLFLVLLKIGRPFRFIYVLRQPQRAWMAREAWIAAFFFPLAGLALWSQARALRFAAALTAVLFLLSQAMILKEAKGIPAWRVFWVVPLVIVTGLAEGSGLFLVAVAQIAAFDPLTQLAGIIAVALAALRAWIWRSYQAALEAEGAPTRTLAILHDFRSWFFVGGLAMPSALIIPGITMGTAPGVLFAIAGVCITATGAALKFIVVTRAGFNQGFALVHTPVRGAGIAGPAVKPGWSRL